ncbi:ABC transporter substrate-binding protein [Aliihoeflea sp. PC F10.4]
MKDMRKLAFASVMALVPSLAFADAASDSATVLFTKELDNANLYFTTSREGTIVGYSAFDTLLYRDTATGEYVGNLATDWDWIDDTTLELKLREGVVFHNGEPFNADDVVYTINTMLDPESGIKNRGIITYLERAEKVDDFTVRLFLPEPYPAALEYLSGNTVIYPNEYYEEVGAQAFSMKPVGTGPYKFTEIVPGQSFTLERFDDYFEGGPKQRPEIKTITVRTIPDVNTQIAELMSGGADFIWQVPKDQADRMAGRSGLNVMDAPTMRVGYIAMDSAKRSSENTPFADKRVRQAMNHAIDRAAITQALLGDKAEVIDSACYPTQFGCEQDVVSYDFDPEKAKALLAEAGYENGFSFDLYAYRDRQLAEAMAGQLANVGITANITVLQYAALVEQTMAGDTTAAFMTWGSGSVNDVAAIAPRFFDGGGMDVTRDPQVIEWLEKAGSVNDASVRQENYSLAFKRIAEEAYWVPLWSYPTTYVLNADLAFEPTPDEIIRFYEMSWK